MSSDFFVGRAGTWYSPIWNASFGVFDWVLERIADLTADPGVEAAVRDALGHHFKMFDLSWYPDEQAAEIVRVILGPLREELPGENEIVRGRVAELITMAEGWEAATDVFPVFLPWRFQRQENGETVRYHVDDRPLDIVFTGVRVVELPDELLNPEISVSDEGYVIRARRFDAVVPADGLRLLGDPYNGPLEHRLGAQ
ncbi:hypothetical protein UK23_27760 [Lentzea aerocolonigenes]|uniref:Uncharacterized protein n=1 Tax=Lentzea aerocolonigenes TaxID=68170 RepID=A0A0F0GQY4_LENAE|nr:hypothetical protein [Lentzea aerocolonigenes]KJK44981.1 hypothetical protein UK23_27760 [Lentzea aerocolonigenes]